MNDFIVYPKYGRMLVLTFVSLIFVGLGITFLSLSFNDGFEFLLALLGVISILFFGLGFVFFLKNLLIRKPALILSDDGLMDQSSYIAPGFLKWEEIMEVQFYQYGGQPFLGIITSDSELIIQRSSGLKRLLNRMNKGLVKAQVSIPVNNLDCDDETLINEITIRWEAKITQEMVDKPINLIKDPESKDIDSSY